MVPSSMEPMVSSGMTSMDPTPGDPVCGEAESTDQLDRNDSLVKKLPGKLREKGLCKVCGDTATGMYFGALVCVPCKVSGLSALILVLYSTVHSVCIYI